MCVYSSPYYAKYVSSISPVFLLLSVFASFKATIKIFLSIVCASIRKEGWHVVNCRGTGYTEYAEHAAYSLIAALYGFS